MKEQLHKRAMENKTQTLCLVPEKTKGKNTKRCSSTNPIVILNTVSETSAFRRSKITKIEINTSLVPSTDMVKVSWIFLDFRKLLDPIPVKNQTPYNPGRKSLIRRKTKNKTKNKKPETQTNKKEQPSLHSGSSETIKTREMNNRERQGAKLLINNNGISLGGGYSWRFRASENQFEGVWNICYIYTPFLLFRCMPTVLS